MLSNSNKEREKGEKWDQNRISKTNMTLINLRNLKCVINRKKLNFVGRVGFKLRVPGRNIDNKRLLSYNQSDQFIPSHGDKTYEIISLDG